MRQPAAVGLDREVAVVNQVGAVTGVSLADDFLTRRDGHRLEAGRDPFQGEGENRREDGRSLQQPQLVLGHRRACIERANTAPCGRGHDHEDAPVAESASRAPPAATSTGASTAPTAIEPERTQRGRRRPARARRRARSDEQGRADDRDDGEPGADSSDAHDD